MFMTDLRALAYELLHEAQQSLREHQELAPTAVVITPMENLIFDIEYSTDEERDEVYSEMIEVAREKNARAILTVNDIYLDHADSSVKLQGAGWGNLAQTPTEAILVVVSGSGFETWTLRCPYIRGDDQTVFQPVEEKRDVGAETELLGDWTGRSGAA